MSLKNRPRTYVCHVSVLVVGHCVSTQCHWREATIFNVVLSSVWTHVKLPSQLFWSCDMLRSLSSFQNLLTCLRSLNPGKYLIYDRMWFLHVGRDSLGFAIVVISFLLEYLVEKFPRTFCQRIHNFIFFCSAFFVISLILVHYFGPNWSLFINLISLSLLLFISNCLEEFKYGGEVFLFNNLIYIGVLIPLLKISKWWIKRFRVIVFHLCTVLL